MAESAFEKWYEHYSIRSKWATAESEIARELMRDAWKAALDEAEQQPMIHCERHVTLATRIADDDSIALKEPTDIDSEVKR